MPEVFLGQIVMCPYFFAPNGWADCDGQILPINQNTALFSLLGTTYGGDGRTTFGLPDLRGRVSMGEGNGPGLTPRDIGEQGGSEVVPLTLAEMPAHTHTPMALREGGGQASPAGNVWAEDAAERGGELYASGGTGQPVQLAPAAVASAGGAGPHPNLQPYLTIRFVIALRGNYPTRP